MAKVEHNYDEASDTHELGVTIDGGFVPFVTMPGPQAAALSASAKARKENGTTDDES